MPRRRVLPARLAALRIGGGTRQQGPIGIGASAPLGKRPISGLSVPFGPQRGLPSGPRRPETQGAVTWIVTAPSASEKLLGERLVRLIPYGVRLPNTPVTAAITIPRRTVSGHIQPLLLLMGLHNQSYRQHRTTGHCLHDAFIIGPIDSRALTIARESDACSSIAAHFTVVPEARALRLQTAGCYAPVTCCCIGVIRHWVVPGVK